MLLRRQNELWRGQPARLPSCPAIMLCLPTICQCNRHLSKVIVNTRSPDRPSPPPPPPSTKPFSDNLAMAAVQGTLLSPRLTCIKNSIGGISRKSGGRRAILDGRGPSLGCSTPAVLRSGSSAEAAAVSGGVPRRRGVTAPAAASSSAASWVDQGPQQPSLPPHQQHWLRSSITTLVGIAATTAGCAAWCSMAATQHPGSLLASLTLIASRGGNEGAQAMLRGASGRCHRVQERENQSA